jgi:hypothetical protein
VQGLQKIIHIFAAEEVKEYKRRLAMIKAWRAPNWRLAASQTSPACANDILFVFSVLRK